MHTVDYLFSLQSKVRRATTPIETADALGELAFAEMRMGRTESAEQKVAELAQLNHDQAHPEIAALHQYLLGVFDYYFGRTTESVANLLNACHVARQAGSARIEARALAALCAALTTLGAHSDAFEAADQALQIGETIGDDRAMATARISLMNLHCDRDDAEAALAQIEAAHPVLARLNDPFTASAFNSSQVNAMIINVRKLMVAPSEENRTAANKILGLCESMVQAADTAQHVKARVGSWRNLAGVHQLLGDTDRALSAINHAITLCQEASSQDNLADAQHAKATYLMHLGCYAEAADILKMARASAKDSRSLSLQENVEIACVECFEKMGHIASALDASKEHARLLSLQRTSERANLNTLRIAKREFAEAQRDATAAREQAAAMGKVQAQLIEDTQKLKQISFEDALTKLKNRRYFDLRFPDLIEHHAQTKTPLSMAIIDIDAFKSINDRFGHVIGDNVLQGVAQALLAHKRATDEVCRLGGDEFVLFLPNTRIGEASALCEYLRAQFSGQGGSHHYGASLSIGLAEWKVGEDHTAFLTRADQKLFVAKREGRNRVAA